MKDFYELAAHRGSCRHYSDKPVDGEVLARCVAAASLAPSACNSQPWRFVIVTNPEKRAALAKLTQFGFNEWSDEAKAFFVAVEVAKPEVFPFVVEHYGASHFAEGDVGIATAYLLLEADDLGLGTCVIGVFDQAKVKELLGIPQEYTVRYVIPAGYPAVSPREKSRKNISDICTLID